MQQHPSAPSDHDVVGRAARLQCEDGQVEQHAIGIYLGCGALLGGALLGVVVLIARIAM